MFRRELARTAFGHCVAVYFECSPLQSWQDAEAEITRSLIEQAGPLAEVMGISGEIPLRGGIVDSVKIIQRRLHCSVVIVIDEAVGLLEGAWREGEVESLQEFWVNMQRTPGVLIVWVGPEAPARRLPVDVGQILQKAEPLRIGSLSLEDVEALLKAKKLSPKYQIELSPRLVEAVFEITAGNPYWVSHIGSEMWRIANRKRRGAKRNQGGAVRYSKDLLDRAVDSMFDLGVPFLDRVRSSAGENNRLRVEVLRVLATFSRLPGGRPDSLPTRDIQTLIAPCKESTEEETLEILFDLQATGSVVCERVRNERRWRISSPILADYLVFINR